MFVYQCGYIGNLFYIYISSSSTYILDAMLIEFLVKVKRENLPQKDSISLFNGISTFVGNLISKSS